MEYSKTTIKSRRLIIRPLVTSDYSTWKQAHDVLLPSQNDFDSGAKAADRLTRLAFRKMLKARPNLWKRDRFYMLGIFEKKTGALVGGINVIPHVRNIFQTAAIGYYVHNTHWRRGYAIEAIEVVTRFAFRDLKLHRITAEIEVKNKASIKTIKKVGFRKEALAKRLFYSRGHWQDAMVFAMTAEEKGLSKQKPKIRLAVAES